MRTIRFLPSVFAVVLWVGCSERNPFSDEPIQALQLLPSGIWKLETFVQGRSRRVLGGTEVTLEFTRGEDAHLHGMAGCNFYGARFSEKDGKLDIGPIGNTEMLCREPKGVMKQEQKYLTALRSVDSFQMQNDQLVLFDISGKPVLVFSEK